MHSIYQEQKKIATPVALIFLMVIFFGVSFFLSNGRQTTSLQAKKPDFERMMIANITYNSASIFWRTKEKEKGWLIYGEENNRLTKTSFDDRDLENQKSSYSNHYVSLKNLKENTKYFFKIFSEKRVVGNSNGSSFEFSTKVRFGLNSNLKPAFGKVINRTGRPVENAVVVLDIAGVDSLLTLTKNSGEWLIPFYYLTKKGRQELIFPKENDSINIEIIDDKGEISKVVTTLKNISPLPQTLMLGENYEFKEDKVNVLSATDERKEVDFSNKIGIIFPREDMIVPGVKPILRGTALSNEKVKVNIDSDPPQTFEVYSNKEGFWNLSPFYPLQPGKRTISITTNNEKAELVQIKRSFYVGKSGEAVLGEATPSATVMPTEPAPTMTEPIVEPTAVYSPSPPPPVSGINFVPLSIFSASLIFFGAGIIFIF